MSNSSQSLLKTFEAFIISDKDASLEDLHNISTLLNAETEPLTKFQEQLSTYTSFASPSGIMKILDLLEFLTVFSTKKLPEIINDEKFVEYIGSGIMEFDFQISLMNLLKLWSDTYRNERDKMNRMFELIANLEMMGLDLPTEYKSKYEGMDVQELISKSKIPENSTPFKTPENNGKTSFESHVQAMEYDIEVEEYIEDRIATYTDGLTRIFAKRPELGLMRAEELVYYKAHPCKDGIRCKNAPKAKKGFSIGGVKHEIQCPYWHNLEDRRRPFYDGERKILYKFTYCKNKDECLYGDNCRKAHNFFESFYHPLNYKKKRCNSGRACKNGKYCPYYHSIAETETWKASAQEAFDINDNEEIIEDDSDWDREESIYQIHEGNTNNHNFVGNVIYSSNENESKKIKENTPVELSEIIKPKILDKKLNSKLTVRNIYVNPSKLTPVVFGNKCFNAMPLFLNKDNEIQGDDKEQSNEK